MTDFETIKYLGGALVIIYLFVLFSGNSNSSTQEENHQNTRGTEKQIKISKMIEKEHINLENIIIKHDELENEIERLKIEGSTNYEKEIENSVKIRKLELNLKHLNIKINEKQDEINQLNKQLKE